jgi:hypothetical protein
MTTEISQQTAEPRQAARTAATNTPVMRSRMRDTSPRVRRPPRWSARVLPRRVA